MFSASPSSSASSLCSVEQNNENDGETTQGVSSAYNYTFNLTSDHLSHIKQNPQEPRQIQNLYAKTSTNFPRCCCLLQLYRNITKVLDTNAVSQHVVFDEGHREKKIINKDFVREGKMKVEELFWATTGRTSDDPSLPVIVIEKETCIAAWEWYSFLFGNALTLFHTPTSQSVATSSKPKTPSNVQKILNIEFNIFMRSALTAKVPDTGKTAPFHNSPHLLDPALQKLLSDGTIIQGYFLLDSKQHKHLSYMKLPVPVAKQNRDVFEKNFTTYQISLETYEENYFHEKKPSNQVLSQEAVDMFRQRAELVPSYHKHQELTEIIDNYLKSGEIVALVKKDKEGKRITCYEVSHTATAFQSQTTPITVKATTTNQAAASNQQTIEAHNASKAPELKLTTVSTTASTSLSPPTSNFDLQNPLFQDDSRSTPQQLRTLIKITSAGMQKKHYLNNLHLTATES
ncbi:unnamed protein product [Didymodactylos carnosus]|uniref:Uncharacterized protein n=1 Tax=Didymodactylos carnosus TaxID=1234261 RepID=A0A816A7M4_9BILA|nr:unnamed protein product [Didymodactylos carnosus]CAF4464775.1 unnamed protein product [Didymodactylos carnosus]